MKAAYLLGSTMACLIVSLATGFLPISVTSKWNPLSRKRLEPRTSRRNKEEADDSLSAPPWKQQPGESEFAYLKRLQQMASNPQQSFTFTTTASTTQNTTITAASSSSSSSSSTPKKAGGGGYVPIETWNTEKYKKTNMTAEERLQFDCKRQGDRFIQNEILRKNLNYFG